MAFNWGKGLAGAGGGAIGGAGAGAPFGPIGVGVGGALGGILGLLGGGLGDNQNQMQQGGFGGNQEGWNQLATSSPEQSQYLSQLLSQLGGSFNPEAMKQQSINRFNQQTIPGLAERFTASTGGRATSPLFATQAGQAGANLEGDLNAQQQQFLLPLLQLALRPQFENVYQQREPGLLEGLLPQLLNFGGQAAGGYLKGKYSS